MDEPEEAPPVLVPMFSQKVVLRHLTDEQRLALKRIRTINGWKSWTKMLYWVVENQNLMRPVHDPPRGGRYLVCRQVPLEIKQELERLRMDHGWEMWSDMVVVVIEELGD